MTLPALNRRVLLLSPWFGPNHFGGIELSAQLAWDALVARSASPELLTFGGPTSAGGKDGAATRTKSGAIRAALSKRWHAEDILVWHLGLLKLLPFLRRPRARVILFLHGIEIWRPLGRLSRLLLSRIDRVLSNSRHTWERALTFHPTLARKPHQVVPLGTGEPLEPSVNPEPRSVPTAVMLGRLSRAEDYKGHREIIGAWSSVRQQVPDAELWIIGDGDLRPDLERMVADRNLQHAVCFLGKVSNEERETALSACRVLLMPSQAEGFGLVYLEALRWGRPALVSTIDAGREVIEAPTAGLAVDPTDGYALAQSISTLLTDGRQWQHWSQQARARYEGHFTAAHFQQRLIAALKADVTE